MYAWKAAIGGPDVGAVELERALEALASRQDVEHVSLADARCTVSGWLEADGTSAFLVFGMRVQALDVLTQLGAALATTLGRSLRAYASGTDTAPAAGRALSLEYAAFDIDADGTARKIEVAEAELCLEDNPSIDSDPKEEVWELLYALMQSDPVVVKRTRDFAVHLRPRSTDPRVAALVPAARSATSVEAEPQTDGRVLVRMMQRDGSKRLAYLSRAQADELERLRR
jgi:hypothetical protein